MSTRTSTLSWLRNLMGGRQWRSTPLSMSLNSSRQERRRYSQTALLGLPCSTDSQKPSTQKNWMSGTEQASSSMNSRYSFMNMTGTLSATCPTCGTALTYGSGPAGTTSNSKGDLNGPTCPYLQAFNQL